MPVFLEKKSLTQIIKNRMKKIKNLFEANRNLRLLCLSSILFSLGDGLFLFCLPVYITQLNASATDVGMLYAVFYLSWGVSLMLGGFLADHFDQRKIMIIGALLWIPLPLALATATDWNQLWLPMILYGIDIGACSFSLYTLRSAPPERTMQAFGLTSAALALGYVISPIPGGFLYTVFGKQIVFLITASFFVACTVPYLFLSRMPSSKAQDMPIVKSTQKFYDAKKLIFTCIFVSLIVFAIFLIRPLIPQFMNSAYNQNIFNLSIFATAMPLGWVVFSLAIGRICAKRSKMAAVLLSTAIFIFAILLITMTGNLYFLFFASFLSGISSCIIEFIPAIIGSAAPEHHVGQWISLSQTSLYIASSIAPIIGGLLFEISPYLAFFTTIILLSFFIIIGLFRKLF